MAPHGILAHRVRKVAIEIHCPVPPQRHQRDHLLHLAGLLLQQTPQQEAPRGSGRVGGQAALTAKTMKDMGFTNVVNLGGVSAWAEAGGPMED